MKGNAVMDSTTRLRRSKLRKHLNSTFVTAFSAACLALFLVPFLYMILTSVKTHTQMTFVNAPLWPAAIPSYTFKGENTGTNTFRINKGGSPFDLVINFII